MTDNCLYLFLDESGEFTFSNAGSKYFIFGCVVKKRPFALSEHFELLKFELIEYGGYDLLTHFHAQTNNNYTRKKVYELLKQNSNQFEFYSNIIQKNKTNPILREPIKFYSKMLGYLIRYVLSQQDLSNYKEIIAITDTIPINAKRELVKKTVKSVLKEMLPDKIKYQLLHHPCMSSSGLQTVDYCCFALSNKYEMGKTQFYRDIKNSLKTEFDFFMRGETIYY